LDGLVSPHDLSDVGASDGDGNAGSSYCGGTANKGADRSGAHEQFGTLQGPARLVLGLSVAEIRRLLWHLVFAFQQTVEQVLAWSHWRRRHQAQAKFWHYKRRDALLTYLQL
jgi:hypothetical protein